MTIDTLLKPFQHFGINLGLERIKKLLHKLNNPQEKIPLIHVAGSNGKGSVCAYLSSVLTEAGYQVGRYTSPHLIQWNERICINQIPIPDPDLIHFLEKVISVINPQEESPTQFEIITATAWLYFAEKKVDIAVMEVGLGGRLDATNICEHPLLTIITSISREHWQILGSTLAEIATEKAGILKPGSPAIIGQLPPEAEAVIENKIKALNCPAIWVKSAQQISPPNPSIFSGRWAQYEGIKYPLPLLGDFQLMNSAIAIASLQILRKNGWNLPEISIQKGMAKTQWSGRIEWINWRNHRLLIDGAHNPAAAKVLRQYVDTLKPENPDNKSDQFIVNWVVGMLSTKDHQDIFEALLKKGDRLYIIPVPDHNSANPESLVQLGTKVCPELSHCQAYPDLITALEKAIESPSTVTILSGSLYLLGHFLSTDFLPKSGNTEHLNRKQ